MFKLESYITPILLSYVDKYIKNFRPEDSQVSLWGGDASFHNLDLRLEVLEQELQLPFSFVSGHVHELLIHVPWTKLASEPISITINTIECILKLRTEDSAASDSTSHASSTTSTSRDGRKKSRSNKQDLVAPPGYVQSLVNKIVSNITIFCNNLILKYVEEDIVLSVNVKTVTFQSANDDWEPAFTELSPGQVMLRKLITLSDLTICLDKRNASGKIEMYQEPLLYRCVLEIHLLRSYHSAKAKRASVTRLDLYCSRMDFSLTEQQVPMLMRLALLALALHGKELRPDPTPGAEQDLDTIPESEQDPEEEEEEQESWAGWAWSWVPSLLPLQGDEDWSSEQQQAYSGHTFHIGFYVQQASISLKVTESTTERSYYGPRKVKFVPFLVMQLHGCYVDMVMHGMGWFNMQLGISYCTLQPYGDCFCGVKEVSTEYKFHDVLYFSAGNDQSNYLADSLFDPTSVENKGQKKTYNVSWDYHLATVTETLLLEKSPAIAIDYLYMLEIPEDFSSERLSELGSDLEYSNLSEKALCRVVVGPTIFHLCTGLFHRLQMLMFAAKMYDYCPYSTPKPELSREQLPPASAEDFEALDASIPLQIYQVTLFKPMIYIHLSDHPHFDASTFPGHRRRRKVSRVQPLYKLDCLPKVTISCQCLDAKMVRPMYPRRLITTTCQLPTPPQHMFHACHLQLNIKLLGVGSHLILGPHKQTTVVMPSNISYSQEKLLLPHYWSSADLPHFDRTLTAESVTVTCTKAQLLVVTYIIHSLFDSSSGYEAINGSTLLIDAGKDTGVEFLELCIDGLSYRQVATPCTLSTAITLGAVKAFVLEQLPGITQQALVLSGSDASTDVPSTLMEEQLPLLACTIQHPRSPETQSHPPVLIFNLRMVRVCMDPLLWHWLHYSPLPVVTGLDVWSTDHASQPSRRSHKLSESSGQCPESTRRGSTPQESVHSSSDRDQTLQTTAPSLSPVALSRDTRSKNIKEEVSLEEKESPSSWSRDYLLTWFPVWRGLVLCGDMAQCVVYLPTDSLSAVGAQSIEDALEQCLKSSPSENTPDVLVIKFPFVTLRSAAQRQGLHQYTSRLPVKLPDNIWSNNKVSFPWSLGLSDLSLYTIQKGKQLYFLKPVSANATVGISTKNQADQTSLASIGFCVHVDTTPVSLSISESQMQLMASVLVGLLQVASAFRLHPVKPDVTVAETPTPTPTSPTMFRESTGSRESPTTPHDTEESSERGQLAVASDSIKITVWMQSTLARLTISLYTEDITKEQPIYDLKLTLDMEDIMTSIDLQQVYLKVKCKIASASIQHFRRFKRKTNWGTGAYLGLVMRGQEDQTTSSVHSLHRDLDDGAGSFLSMTFTRARCCHVHSRWGTRKQSTLLAHTRNTESSLKVDSTKNSSRFISEIVVKLQPVDFVFSPSTLSSFLRVLQPLLLLPSRPHIHTGPEPTTTFDWAMYINNATLPLLYLDTRSVRLIMPAADLTDIGEIHDVFMFQLEEITLSPQVENPLGRVMVRSDIYHMAEQARILGVPGSEVEDRQYQLDIVGFSVSTGTWRELDRCLSVQGASTSLHTMIENPALEWNSLVQGRESITPYVSLLPVVSRMNLCVVAAPAIVYREDILVCGHSLEVNAITDIIVSVSTTQLLLASALFTELISLFEPLLADFRTSGSLPPGLRTHPPSEEHLVSVTDYTRGADSGIDCADVSSASTRILKDEAFTPGVNMSPRESVDTTRSSNYQATTSETRQSVSFISKRKSVTYKDVLPKEVGPKKTVYNINDEKNRETRLKRLVPVEILLTSGTISLVVYELLAGASHPGSIFRYKFFSSLGKSNHTEDKGYEGSSEEGSTDEVLPNRKLVQPLIFFLMAQPHAFLSRQSFSRKVQISCFDLSVRTSTLGNVVHKAIPTNEDFPSILVETKCGEPHPDTGIPPSFLTIKWSRMINKPAKLEVDIGRPTKVYVSIARWHYLQAVADRLLDCVEDITNLPSWSSSRLVSSDKFLNKDNMPKQDEEEEEVELQEEDAKMEPSRSQILSVRFRDEELVGIEEAVESLKEEKSLLNDILDEDGDDDEPSESCDDTPGLNISEEHHLQSVLGRIAALSVSSQQLVVAIETSSGMELAMSVAGLSGSLTCISRTQADRIVNNIAVNSFIVTTKTDNITRLLLNPWSFTVDLCFAWEAWHSEPPQIQLTADSDCIMFDIGPDHLRCLHYVWKDYEPLLSTLSTPLSSSHVRVNPRAEYEQHYRDDLRAGAFQFVEASGSREEMPLPYQVVFWGSPPTMAWRYPQPRVLTRVDVFPVPFKVATTKRHGSEDVQDRVLCTLQYWSECQARYQSYAQFQLSESEPCHLELPTSPRRAVACTWRVRLALQSEEEVEDSLSRVSVSPHALAACMRVDSFFSPAFVPTLQAAINISSLQVALYNHLSLDKFDKSMPPPLQNFIIDNLIPESQCFLSAALDSCSLFVCSWPSGESVVELSSRVRCDVIDYAYLTQQCIVDPFQMQLNCTLGSILEVSCVAKPISIRLGPAVGHTLAVSTQLWSQAWQTFLQESDSNSSPQHQVIVSRYVVCNDTTRSLRFGQMTTDEDILLLSRQCHLYSWRTQKAKQQLRVGVEDGGWVWSKPFTIDSDGIQLCPLGHSRKYDVAIVVSVTSLSMTQKQIVISGQLVITNLLSEPFECKVLPVTDDDNKPRAGQCLVAPGQSTPPSILLNSACKTILRVRFQGLDSVWSGDIPLNETPKTGQPWLVKIPLQEKGQFLSIWCRVIYQSINHGQKILAMLCPLYMIRSHLPIPAKIFIDTPGLKVHLQTTIKGKGQQQQLYCPGTVDHSHKLMLQLENGIPPSNPYVPLSYTMIDQRTFFKITSYEDLDIDNILKSLVADQDRTWPFVGEEYKDVEWVDTEQPETFVQVKYKPLGPFCSTLLVDLQPWALMINTLGCTISLIVQEKTLCIVPHNGVIMPPKLEETFHLVLQTVDGECSSPSLQLARPDWGSSFYMPRIAGLIPVTGEIQIVIQNAEVVNFANITSELMEDMRIVHIRPNYILCNHTSIELEVATLSVRDSSERWKVSDDEMDICTYSLPPDPSAVYNAGTPLIQWALIGNGDKDLVQYAAFNMKCGWSCPVRVSNGLPRYGFTIPNQFSDDNETTNEAFVLTSQERAGQVYLCVLPEPYPQVTVYNKCNFKILCAQGTPENDGNAVPENMHIEWWCEIERHTSAHYCPPGSSKQFPGLVSPGALPPLVFSLDNEDKKVWSLSVSIAEVQEQFVCLPGRGDVKVRVELRCHTTYITVETVSHVEISARDIRSRLLERDLEMAPAQVEALCSQEVYSIDKSENSGRCNVSSSSSKMKNSSAKSVDRSYSCETAVENFSLTTASSYDSALEVLTFSPYVSRSSSKKSNISESSTISKCVIQDSELEEVLQDDTCISPMLHAVFFVKGIHITLMEDLPKSGSERTEVVLFSLDNVCVSVHPRVQMDGAEDLDINLVIGDLQIDNQMYQRGGFDFPVVLLGQSPGQQSGMFFSLNAPAKKMMEDIRSTALVSAAATFERNKSTLVAKHFKISVGPLSAYIEDTLVTKLMDDLACFLPTKLVYLPVSGNNSMVLSQAASESLVPVPQAVYWDASQLASPLRLRTLVIEPLSVLLSVHTSITLYLALDHSPLHFATFERHQLVTTPYRLGHTITMHYLSGAIFGMGWVVGSLEILGSPGGFARTLGTGLRDFVNLPYQGILQGPWAFLVGVSHGSASLMKHITAGTLSSVTKLAASVARNLDRLTLDREHLQRTEELRRQRPQGLAQGLLQGLTGLGISLLGAVGGIAHHPLQSVMTDGASTRGLVTGVGLGLVGVITKPLSGAAELVALTGEGLLQGTGWTVLPEARQQPVIEHTFCGVNSRLKYSWKLVAGLAAGKHTLLYVTEATCISSSGTYEAVALVLTTRALFLVNMEEDITQRVLSLAELSGVDHPSDPTLLCFHFLTPGPLLEMDATSHARVVDFVRRSSGLVSVVNNEDQPETDSSVSCSHLESDLPSSIEMPLTFYVNPQSRNYFLSVLALAKRQSQGKGFSIL